MMRQLALALQGEMMKQWCLLPRLESLMQHIERHAAATRGSPANDITSCAFCYRRFSSPFTLQCHLEAVHTNYQSTAVCKICELSFVNEQGLLQHMKMTHKPGEMPYVCQVCGFRSSFYSVLRGHFETVHADTYSMLCLYCLRVHRYYVPYQNHHSKHQRRNVFPCGSCRLYFLSSKERADHKVLHHGTHLRPPQVHNLPPGTTVTVRAYTVIRGRDELKNRPVPSKVIDMAPRPPPQESPRAKPPETSSPLSLQRKTRSR
ncbi:Zinc finger protein 280D [Merluccius polli]|uniref:Zinc finger protein 280D n=1 Tax=Merluccius polli TaxID=89951 RepID=A0AA47P0K6_MERPO|nr:Zinc finger protein 280D [Merluccius polli]